MAFEDIDRRRAVILALLTLIALPAIYFYSQNNSSAEDDADATTPGSVVVVDAPNRPPIVVNDADPPFLDGPVGDANPGVREIAIPTRPDNPPLELTASYRSTVPGVRACLVREVNPGLTVNVKNLDNGRSVTCVTARASTEQIADVILHTDSFTQLADPTEAPIAVELTQ